MILDHECTILDFSVHTVVLYRLLSFYRFCKLVVMRLRSERKSIIIKQWLQLGTQLGLSQGTLGSWSHQRVDS